MDKSTLRAGTAIGSFSALSLAVFGSAPALAQTVKDDKAPASELKTEQEIKSGEKAVSAQGPTTRKEATSPTGEIVVTGSRIRRPNLDSGVPVTSISGKEFFETGNVSIGDTLNQLPSLRNTFSQANSTRFLGTSGLNLLDLRGLGTQRTLVLVNGRRQVGGDILNSGVSTDTNTIPTDLIDRVDIVTGGNSAVYGSDAIAGVVNFILKDHYQGIQLRAQAGISKYRDAGGYFISGLAGHNFAGGRGNIALNVEYARQDSYTGAKRPFVNNQTGFILVNRDKTNGIANNQLFSNILSGSYSNFGVVRFGGGSQRLNCGTDSTGNGFNCPFTFTPTGQLIPITGQRVGFGPTGQFIGGNGLNFNLAPPAQLSPQLDRVNVDLLAHLEITPAVVPFVEAKYSRTRTVGYGNNGPAFINGGVLGDPAQFADYYNRETVSINSPYLDPQARALIILERALNGQRTGNGFRFAVRENLLGLGARTEDAIRQTYRAVGGIKGDLGSGFNYEIAANYSRLNEKTNIQGNLNIQRFLLANDAVRDPASGNIVCRSKIDPAAAIPYVDNGDAASANILAADVSACTPINVLGGQFTDAQRAYVLQDTLARGRASQFDLTAFLAGSTEKFFRLPGGPIGFVIGAERRTDKIFYDQDPLVSNGYTFYNAIPTLRAPKNKVTEGFAEVRLPIAKDVPGFQELELDAAARISHYTLGQTGTVRAYNITGQWAPIHDVRFRANYARAVRAPNQVELFTPFGQNYDTVIDPCSSDNINQGQATRPVNCAASGVPAGYFFQYSSSLPYQSGGNPKLQAEKSNSYTVGTVVTPQFMPGLSISVDYYTIKVLNTISAVSAQTILNQCVDSGSVNNPYCALFQRAGSGGGPNGEIPGQIIDNSLHVGPVNFAKLTAQGIDTEIAYRHQIANLGRLDTRFTYSHVTNRTEFLNPIEPTRATRIKSGLGDPIDRFTWKSSLEHGRFTFGYQMRYIGKQTVFAPSNIYSVQGRPPTNPNVSDPLFYPTRLYNDVRLGIDATNRFNFYLGVDNVANTKPPLGLTGIGGGSGIYDNRGRYYYTGIVAKF